MDRIIDSIEKISNLRMGCPELDELKNCTKCGGNTFGEGLLKGDGRVYPAHTIWSIGSEAVLTICIKCGEVNSIRVKEPEKFKRK